MSRRSPCWPSLAGYFQRPAQSTPYEHNRHRLHGIASVDSSTTSHSSTNPFSVGFQGTGLGQVPASSYYPYYVADYTNTPITNCNPMQNMTGSRAVTADNVQGAYTGRVTVPNALNVHTSGTNMGKNPVASSHGVPMPQARREGHWDEEEHRNFLRGLNDCGWGRWKLIADKYVTTRNEYQICSHAQKYRSHRNGSSSSRKTPGKKRRSIHDTTLEDESGKALPLPVPPCDKGDSPAMQPQPPRLPEDSRGRMTLPIMSDAFDIGALTQNDLGEVFDQYSSSLPFTNSLFNGRG